MTPIFIIADDLTSAADGAAPFVARGLTAVVSRGPHVTSAAEITAIDLATRAMELAFAAKAVDDFITHLPRRAVLFKTMDSTLRGHVKSEIMAAMKASGRKHLIVAPAFPDTGRVTRGGYQFVDGIAVDQSDYANDPAHPATSARITDLLDTSLGNCLVLGAIDPTPTNPSTAPIILDCDCQADLDRWIRDWPYPEDTLFVGSPGMALALAARHTLRSPQPLPHVTCALVIVGSANPISLQQLTSLRASNISHHSVALDDVIDASPSDALNLISDRASTAISKLTPDLIIATGGETMDAVLERIGITQFDLLGEVAPGFPVGRASLSNNKFILIAMKAGGFGGKFALVDALNILIRTP